MPSESKKIIATTNPNLHTGMQRVMRGNEVQNKIPQIPQSFIEHYANYQPEKVELEYYMHMRNPDPIRDEYKIKLLNNEVVWVEPSKELHNKAMKYAYGLCTLEEVERLLLEFRQDHLYTFDMTSEEDVKKWLKENLKL
jgi:hypothetical protein